MSTQQIPQITIASLSLPEGVDLDLDPLDAGHHVLLAVTGPDGVRVRVRLWVPEQERSDWARAVEAVRGTDPNVLPLPPV